jgi:hypothetical protein
MKRDIILWPLIVCATIVLWCASFVYAFAAIPATYTNDNFLTSTHDAPVMFTQDAAGNFSGYTKSGKTFEQLVIHNGLGVKLHRFMIDEAFFYISDKGIIWAENDTVALSIYLTRTM